MKRYLHIPLFLLLFNVAFSQDSSSFSHGDTLTILKSKTVDVVKDDSPGILNIRSSRLFILIDSNQNSIEHENFDVNLFRSINNNRSKFKDAVIPVFDKSMMPMAILMPISTFTYGRIYNKTYEENTGYLLIVSEAAEMGLTFGIKYLVKRKRPYASLPRVFRGDTYTADPYSFPSGHTSTAFSIATIFALRYPKYPQVYVPIYLWSLVVAYGRPYLGMHYPSDLLGGAAIGAGSSILIYSLRKELLKFKNNIFKENKADEGSINGGVISIFTGSFLLTGLLNNFIFYRKSICLGVYPFGLNNQNSKIYINWKF